METKKINLFVFDTPDNYKESAEYLGAVGTNLKSMHLIQGVPDLKNKLEVLGDDDFVFMVVHVFSSKKVSGIKRFIASGIAAEFPNLKFIYISEGNSDEIQHQMLDAGLSPSTIYKNHQVITYLKNPNTVVSTKAELLKTEELGRMLQQYDYAVITALYEDEFEELEKVFDFPTSEIVSTHNKDYRTGYLKSDPSKKIIAAFQNTTGMVDAAIIATHMLEKFKPKYLLMSGVCGGTPDSNIGDIIVAKQIFTFQKGKISDLNTKDSEGKPIPVQLFTQDQKPVEYDKLYDQNGKQVALDVEKFEREKDSTVDIDTRLEDTLRMNMKRVMERVNRNIRERNFNNTDDVKAIIEPMACSTMVINKEGYFEDMIKSVDRKTAAVEMESFGVARACKFGNDGNTKPLIFKSVMDFTKKKSDVVGNFNRKKFAAATSAQFLAALFEENII